MHKASAHLWNVSCRRAAPRGELVCVDVFVLGASASRKDLDVRLVSTAK